MGCIQAKTASLENDHSYDKLENVSTRLKRVVQVEEGDLPFRRKVWPPWPFNLIGKKRQVKASDDGYPSTGALFWEYLRHRSRVGVRQLQQREYTC